MSCRVWHDLPISLFPVLPLAPPLPPLLTGCELALLADPLLLDFGCGVVVDGSWCTLPFCCSDCCVCCCVDVCVSVSVSHLHAIWTVCVSLTESKAELSSYADKPYTYRKTGNKLQLQGSVRDGTGMADSEGSVNVSVRFIGY